MQQSGELRSGQDTLIGEPGVRPLVRVQMPQRVRRDVAAAYGEAEHAAERHQQPVDRPGREPFRSQFCDEGGEVVGGDQLQPSVAESREHVPFEGAAVVLERALAPLAGSDLRLELAQPPPCDLADGQPRRGRQKVFASRATQQLPLPARLFDGARVNGAEARLAVDHHAKAVDAVGLQVDPTLHPLTTPSASIAGHLVLQVVHR